MKFLNRVMTAAALILAVSCGSSQSSDKNADLTISCEPEVLEVVGGKINVTVCMNFPAGYLHPTGLLTVTPVIVYEGGQRTGKAFICQGERIKANYIEVSSKGGVVKQNLTFDYIKGMEQCYLELRLTAVMGEKPVELPAIKVADGAVVTYQLADLDGLIDFMPDGYQEVTTITSEMSVFYDVNSDAVQNSSRNRNSIKQQKEYLSELKSDERATIKSAEIIAYASPEGGEEYNAELSERRSKSAEKTWAQMARGIEAGETKVVSVGQDWEGFQEAISHSKIEDKDLILRVLSMYSDPEVRENEIKNMSLIYSEIAEQVFPDLRRANFVVTSEYQNYSDEELQQIAAGSIVSLTLPQTMHLGTIAESRENKALYYRLAAEKFNAPEAWFNLAVLAIENGVYERALSYLENCEPENPDVLNAKGVIALRKGKLDEAADLFAKSETETAKENAGIVLLLKGEYKEAAAALEGMGGKNEAVALILVGEYDKALAALGECGCPASSYIKAVIAARKGDAAKVAECLENASKIEALKTRSAKDVEFVKFR